MSLNSSISSNSNYATIGTADTTGTIGTMGCTVVGIVCQQFQFVHCSLCCSIVSCAAHSLSHFIQLCLHLDCNWLVQISSGAIRADINGWIPGPEKATLMSFKPFKYGALLSIVYPSGAIHNVPECVYFFLLYDPSLCPKLVFYKINTNKNGIG